MTMWRWVAAGALMRMQRPDLQPIPRCLTLRMQDLQPYNNGVFGPFMRCACDADVRMYLTGPGRQSICAAQFAPCGLLRRALSAHGGAHGGGGAR